jgi:hypothetical protein
MGSWATKREETAEKVGHEESDRRHGKRVVDGAEVPSVFSKEGPLPGRDVVMVAFTAC